MMNEGNRLLLEKVKNYYKDAKVVKCAMHARSALGHRLLGTDKAGHFEINLSTIRFHRLDYGSEDDVFIICDSIPENATSYIVLYSDLNDSTVYAPIISIKMRMIDNSHVGSNNTFLDKQLKNFKNE